MLGAFFIGKKEAFMSNNSIMLDPILVTTHDNPAPITIGGVPYYPGPSFNISYEGPINIRVKPVNLKAGQVGLVNLAEFTINIRNIDGQINQYNAQLSKDDIYQSISDAKKWLDEYILDFENSREIEVYIELLEEA